MEPTSPLLNPSTATFHISIGTPVVCILIEKFNVVVARQQRKSESITRVRARVIPTEGCREVKVRTRSGDGLRSI